MKTLEPEARKAIVKSSFVLVWICLALDIVFFAVYIAVDDLSLPPDKYILYRMLPPFLITLGAYLTAYFSNKSEVITEERKNRIVSTSLCITGGAMAIFHAFFVPLWLSPAITMVVASIFDDKKLRRQLAILSYIMIFASCADITWERPERTYEYLQNVVVVCAINTVIIIIITVVSRYNKRMLELAKGLYSKQQEYKEQLDVDFLTGVYSRAHMTKEGQRMLYRASEHHPVSVAIIDIDNFKKVNDTYGHENGDVVLKTLGRLLQTQLKDDCVVGRYGGEEFVIIMEGTTVGVHKIKVDWLRTQFSSKTYEFKDEPVTFSGGICSVVEPAEFLSVLKRADDALYVSKNSGKNRLTVAE